MTSASAFIKNYSIFNNVNLKKNKKCCMFSAFANNSIVHSDKNLLKDKLGYFDANERENPDLSITKSSYSLSRSHSFSVSYGSCFEDDEFFSVSLEDDDSLDDKSDLSKASILYFQNKIVEKIGMVQAFGNPKNLKDFLKIIEATKEIKELLKECIKQFLLLKNTNIDKEMLVNIISRICEFNSYLISSTVLLNPEYPFFLVNVYGILDGYNLVDLMPENLQSKIFNQYCGEISKRFERSEIISKNKKFKRKELEISKNDIPNLSLELSAILTRISKLKGSTSLRTAANVCKLIIQMNQKYFIQNGHPVDLGVLMDPKNMQKFNLMDKSSEIVQADIIFFYQEAVAKLQRSGKKGHEAGGCEFAELSQNYIEQVFERFNTTTPLECRSKILNEIVMVSTYSLFYRDIFELDERNEAIKNVFGKYNFIIPKAVVHSSYEKVKYKILTEKVHSFYEKLALNTNFLVNLKHIVLDKIHEMDFQINPFENFSEDQIISLKEFLGDFKSWPECLRIWIAVKEGLYIKVQNNIFEIDLKKNKGQYSILKDRINGYKIFYVGFDSELNEIQIQNKVGFENKVDEMTYVSLRKEDNKYYIPGGVFSDFIVSKGKIRMKEKETSFLVA